MRTITLKTWSCPCGYKQDFEPTEENNAIHFKGLSAGLCPSCKKGSLAAETDEAKCVKVEIAEIGDVKETPEEGEPVLHDKDTVASAEKVAELEAKAYVQKDAKDWNTAKGLAV